MQDRVAPPAGVVKAPAAIDVAVIAAAVLRSPWPTRGDDDGTWRRTAGPVVLIFGLREARPFVRRIGTDAIATSTVTDPRVHDAARRDPDASHREAERGAKGSR